VLAAAAAGGNGNADLAELAAGMTESLADLILWRQKPSSRN
jgi:hypothetical protein